MTDEQPRGLGADGYRTRPGRPPADTTDARAGAPRRGLRSTTPDETFAATAVRWDITRVPLDRIESSSIERARHRFGASLPDLVWNAAALEGNTFTLPEVRTLLDGVTVGGRPLDDEKQVLALVDGYTHLDELVASGSFSLSKSVSDDLHRRVAVHEAIESGGFRGEGDVGGGGTVRLASGGLVVGVPQSELAGRFAASADFLEALDDPRERALGYFVSATRSQFYFDGNKRTARLMMTGLLMSEGYEAVSLPVARKFEFNKALDILFTDDDATPLMAFIASCASRA